MVNKASITWISFILFLASLLATLIANDIGASWVMTPMISSFVFGNLTLGILSHITYKKEKRLLGFLLITPVIYNVFFIVIPFLILATIAILTGGI